MNRVAVNVIASLAIGVAGLSQTLPKFEVASVKLAEGGGPPGDIPKNMDPSPGKLAMYNVPLRYCIEWAYNLKDYEIQGPDWIKFDNRYDILGKAAGPVPEEQLRLMLQSLIVERFQMKTHREPKDTNVYVLSRGKSEPKVKLGDPNGQPGLAGSADGVTFHNQPISRFTFLLTRRLDRPVLDGTALSGIYDFTVDISGLPVQGKEPEGVPSIFTTVQRDLGLKLEARKQAVPMLVIDSVNKVPTEN